jgi:hypothetical protein
VGIPLQLKEVYSIFGLFEGEWNVQQTVERLSIDGSDDLMAKVFVPNGYIGRKYPAEEYDALTGIVLQFGLCPIDIE